MSTLHIVIIGSGFAALTAVRELCRRSKDVRITLVAPKADLNIDVTGYLAKQRVEFHVGRLLKDLPGMTEPAWASETGLPLLEGGLFKADAHCQVTGSDKVYVADDSGSHPGSDWLPKQAHMADLRAKAAAENRLRALDGKPATARLKSELTRVVDTLDSSMQVCRSEKLKLVLSACRLFRWAKHFFEWQYLRAYRKAGRV